MADPTSRYPSGAESDDPQVDDRPDPTVPPISWCRIFQVGPACKHLCDGCATTYRRERELTR